MEYKGGGWTMVLHSQKTNLVSYETQLKQSLGAWIANGLGTTLSITDHLSSAAYVMPLSKFKRLLDISVDMRIEGDNIKVASLPTISRFFKYFSLIRLSPLSLMSA